MSSLATCVWSGYTHVGQVIKDLNCHTNPRAISRNHMEALYRETY